MPSRTVAALAACALVVVALFGPAQQPPAPPPPPPRAALPLEQEEANPKTPDLLKRINVDDDLSDVAAAAGAYYVRFDEVVRAAAAAKNPIIKQYLLANSVAYDRVVERAKGRKPFRVTPLPLLWGGAEKFPDEFGLVPLDDQNRPAPVLPAPRGQVIRVDPFESLVLIDADRLLNSSELPPKGVTVPLPGERLAAVERVLSDTLLFHDRARELNRRKGKEWDPLKAAVNDKLTEVRVARIRQCVTDKEWATVRALGARMAERYRNEPKVLEAVFAARLAEAADGAKSEKLDDLERVRALLNEYDARFPGSKDETVQRLRKLLQERAQKMLTEATRVALENPAQAKNILRSIESLEPDLPGLRERQKELRTGYSVLLVATRRLPDRMSPATARSDSERQAVELMFEGLTEAVPDETVGVRYRPALAADRPLVATGLRDLPLVGSAEWAGAERGLFALDDLTATMTLLRRRADAWDGEPMNWLSDPASDPGDPGRVRLRFLHGHPDPRGLLTFKMLPGRWLTTRNKSADDIEFARQPFGTGPYRLSPKFVPAGPGERLSEVAFAANSSFGKRPGRASQPAIKEVRFVEQSRIPDPVAAFKDDLLQVMTDVPTADLARYRANDNQGGKVQVVTAAVSRRVHILAVNHRRPTLQSVDLRRGISHAIDREGILTEVFRAGVPDVHRALAGPFPPGSWACPKPGGTASPSLFNRDLGAAKLKDYRTNGGAVALTLTFPDDDPLARAACQHIKSDVEAGGGVSLILEPLPPREVYRRVEEEHRFDLAYLPIDYPDDWYPLGLSSLLDPRAAGPGGRNVLGYLAPGTNPSKFDDELGRLLAEARLYRDPAGKLAPLTHEMHRRFNDAMPFIPLWHLDRHMVLAKSVKVHFDNRPEEVDPKWLDQTTLFNGIAHWQIKTDERELGAKPVETPKQP